MIPLQQRWCWVQQLNLHELTLCKDVGNVPAFQISAVHFLPFNPCSVSVTSYTGPLSGSLTCSFWHPYLKCDLWMTANSQVEITLHCVARPTLCTSCAPCFCSANSVSQTQRSVFPLLSLRSSASMPPTAAATQSEKPKWHHLVFSAHPEALRNLSHSWGFDTFLFKSNTSRETG